MSKVKCSKRYRLLILVRQGEVLLSANALQEHFTLPYENEQPIPLTIPKEEDSGLEQELQGSGLFDEYGSGLGLMAGNGSSNEAQEAAFDRELRRKKKKRKGRNL